MSEKQFVEQAFSLKPPEEGISRIRVMEDDGSDTYRAVQGRALSFGVGCFMAISPNSRAGEIDPSYS